MLSKLFKVVLKINSVSKLVINNPIEPKKRALKHINGSHEDVYKYLPKYCEDIKSSNLESTTTLEINPDAN